MKQIISLFFFILILSSISIGKTKTKRFPKSLYNLETNETNRLNKWNSTKNGAILVFFSTTCPICLNHIIELDSIYNICKKNNFGMYLILPHTLYLTSKEITKFRDSLNIKIPILVDKKNKTIDCLHVTVLPDAILFDSAYSILYNGQITNKFINLGIRKATNISYYLEGALNCYLQDKTIEIKNTEPIGCKIEKYK